jgi:diguanylate cyclase (GGDEF)-like protein/PAS domain S-box-containing protein
MIERKLNSFKNLTKPKLKDISLLHQNNNCNKDLDSQSIYLTEDNYKIIFENSAAAITVTDQNENLVLWNQLAADLLNMKYDELKNKPIKQIYTDEEWKRIRSEHIRQKGIHHHMDTKILNSAGKVIDVDLSVSVLKGPDGSVKGSIGIMRDISERKKVEHSLKESMELSRGMIETAATAIFLIKDGRFTFVNRILEEMTGYSTKELKDLKRLDLIFPEYLDKAQSSIQNLTTGRSTEPQIFRVLRKDLETIWVSEKLTSIVYSDKEHIMGNWMDITDWKIAESISSEHSNQTEILLEIGTTVGRTLNLREIAESVLDILIRKLHNGPIAFFSLPVQTETFTLQAQRGFSEDFIKLMNKPMSGKGLIGRTALSGKSMVLGSNSDDPRFDSSVLQKYGLKSFCSIPVFARDKINGVICLGSSDHHYSLNKQTRLLELVANQIGVAIDNASLYERISEIAFIDGITGLYNRRFFEEGLKRELSRTQRNGQPFSIISFDLDNLKIANDNFGHQTGDRLLKEFGAILLKQTRKVDIAARVGGDEFMVLVAECDQDSANLVAQRIWSQVNSTHIEADGESINMSVSGGISGYPLHGNTIEILLKKADEAMYRAKRAGKNQVFMATP